MPRWVLIARRVHRAIALAIGLHFVLIATTGAAFVFEPELKLWSRSLRGWAASDGDVGPDRCYAEIQASFPEWSGTFLSFPDADNPFYSAYLGTDSDYFWTDVLVDPGSGRIVGTIDNSSVSIEGFLQVAVQLHIRLCGGELGRKLVDASVVLFVIELVTGVLLWSPGFRRLGRAFRLRLRRSRFLAFYDVHRLVGVIAAPLLIVMALTGLLWGYPRVMVPLIYWCCGERAPVDATAYREPDETYSGELLKPDERAVPLDQVVRQVEAQLSSVAIEYVSMDDPRSRIVSVGIRYADGRQGEGHTETLSIDRHTGRLIERASESKRPPTFAERLTGELAHELHYGTFGGLPTRILTFLACLSVNVLYVTGIWMWLRKRRKRSSGSKA